MEPFEPSTMQRLKSLLSICTFGLLAPVLIKFRKREQNPDEFFSNPEKKYEMTVNQEKADDDDDADEKRKFFLSTRKRFC